MTKLSRLLGNTHPLFRYNIEQLEKATGNAGLDTRLAADILERAHRVIRSIGLDPVDSTPMELQGALHAHLDEDILEDCEFVIYELDDTMISFNRDDIEANHRFQYAKSETVVQHAVEKLKLELIKRYADHERTHDSSVYSLFDEIGISANATKN